MKSATIFLIFSAYAFAQSKPVTATLVITEQRFLADGTAQTAKSAQQFYRDADGRTRIESQGRAVISDPVRGNTIILDFGARVAKVQRREPSAGADAQVKSGAAKATLLAHQMAGRVMKKPAINLGQQHFVGLTATGYRAESVTSPGFGGHIQPMRVVTEFWQSNSLNLLVKVVTMQSNILQTGDRLTNRHEEMYTNIVPTPGLAPSLFEVPQGFRVVSPEGSR